MYSLLLLPYPKYRKIDIREIISLNSRAQKHGKLGFSGICPKACHKAFGLFITEKVCHGNFEASLRETANGPGNLSAAFGSFDTSNTRCTGKTPISLVFSAVMLPEGMSGIFMFLSLSTEHYIRRDSRISTNSPLPRCSTAKQVVSR